MTRKEAIEWEIEIKNYLELKCMIKRPTDIVTFSIKAMEEYAHDKGYNYYVYNGVILVFRDNISAIKVDPNRNPMILAIETDEELIKLTNGVFFI